MFLKTITHLKNSLSIRLSFWYALIFTVSSLIVLIIFYLKIAALTIERIDAELMEEMTEFSEVFQRKGMKALKEEIALEAESEGVENIFFELVSESGDILARSNPHITDAPLIGKTHFSGRADQSEPLFATITYSQVSSKLRVIESKIGKNIQLRIGISLKEKEEYLTIFRKLILLLLLPLSVFAAVVGWFMAKKALEDVARITRTAEEITRGAYHERVHVENQSLEIDRLAAAFNQMVDKLQSVIKGIREMSDNIAHDLRSPLTRIRGIAEMNLLGKKSLSNFEDMAISTVEECDNLILMINTMLEITETEAGVGKIKFEFVDLIPLIHEACDLFNHIAKEKKIQLTTSLPKRAIIHSDRARLQRLVTNLLENAIKYTPVSGCVQIILKGSETQFLLEFKDNGVGISEVDLPRIFDRFYRCDDSRSEPGVGLGLSLGKAIAGALGGSISVQSNVNEGSSFLITLPSGT